MSFAFQLKNGFLLILQSFILTIKNPLLLFYLAIPIALFKVVIFKTTGNIHIFFQIFQNVWWLFFLVALACKTTCIALGQRCSLPTIARKIWSGWKGLLFLSLFFVKAAIHYFLLPVLGFYPLIDLIAQLFSPLIDVFTVLALIIFLFSTTTLKQGTLQAISIIKRNIVALMCWIIIDGVLTIILRRFIYYIILKDIPTYIQAPTDIALFRVHVALSLIAASAGFLSNLFYTISVLFFSLLYAHDKKP